MFFMLIVDIFFTLDPGQYYIDNDSDSPFELGIKEYPFK